MKLRNRWAKPFITAAQVDHMTALMAFNYTWDSDISDLFRRKLAEMTGPDPVFEFICDNPVGSARFRLKWGEDGPRVAYYPIYGDGNPEIQEKCDQQTESLRRIMRGQRLP